MAKPQTYVLAALHDTHSTEWSKHSPSCVESFLREAPEMAAAHQKASNLPDFCQ